MSANTVSLFRAINATTQLFGPPVASASHDPLRRLPFMWVLSPMFQLTLPNKSSHPMPITWPDVAVTEYELWLESISSKGVVLNEIGLPKGIEVLQNQTSKSTVSYRYSEIPPHISRTVQCLEWKPHNDKKLPWRQGHIELVTSRIGWLTRALVLSNEERSRS